MILLLRHGVDARFLVNLLWRKGRANIEILKNSGLLRKCRRMECSNLAPVTAFDAAFPRSDFDLPFDQIASHHDALVIPFNRRERSGRAFRAGVFTASGDVAPHSDMRALDRWAEPTKDLRDKILPTAAPLAGSWLFCGIGSMQAGHIITRGLGRLWATKQVADDVRLLFAAFLCHDDQHTFLTRMLDQLGINRAYRILQEPAIVETLITAPDLFNEQSGGQATQPYAAWARVRAQSAKPSRYGRKIYITRDRLSGVVGRHLCEDVLERNLARAGYDILAPERLSLSDQMATYANADIVIAADGTALHILPFSIRDDAKVIVINRRPDVPELIKNQLDSFSSASVTYVDAIKDTFWPAERADNVSLVELDFAKLRDALAKENAIPANAKWDIPTKAQFEISRSLGRGMKQKFMTDVERPAFLRQLREKRAEAKTMKDSHEPDQIPEINGTRYFRVLKRLHEQLNPDWYLEVGTFTGKSLTLASCNTIAVDPNFQIKFPVINPTGRQMFFFQQTSDDFFESGFIKNNKISVDFAFLDGMHLFEFLLRDFIQAEKVMRKGGVIALHDCCPTTEYMATRDFHSGPWTGDVWKTLLILLRYRPDLKIDVTTAGGTGLVLVRNLNPRSQVLGKKYDALVKEYMDQTLSDQEGGIGGYYRNFELVDPNDALNAL